MKFKAGDEVFIRAEITDISDCEERPYFVAPDCRSVHWVSEDKIIPMGKTYADGLSDAWKMADKLNNMPLDEVEDVLGIQTCREGIFSMINFEEALAKIEAYEDSRKIKVGDVVECPSENHEGIVTCLLEKEVYIIWSDGSCGQRRKADLKKTGRKAEGLSELLRQIGE